MDHPDFLRAEDLPAFERVLDRALDSPVIQGERRGTPGALNNEQLRTRALGARAAIAVSAAAEYRAYRRLVDGPGRSDTARDAARRESGIGATVRRGALPAAAVLVPGLSAAAAVVFGLIGFAVRAVDQGSELAEVLLGAGLAAVGVAVVTALAGLVGLLVMAAGNRSPRAGGDAEADRAREAWEGALLERGMLPFLTDSLRPAAPGPVDAAAAAGPSSATGHGGGVPKPRKGPAFSTPHFSAPDFSSPDFSSPDFTGPEASDPDFAGPDFTGPGFAHPGFTGPGSMRPGAEDPDHKEPGYQGPGYKGPALPESD